MADPPARSGSGRPDAPAAAPVPGARHVCFLTSSAPLGADDPYSPFILGLAERMNRRGYRVTILTPHVAGSATREVLRGVTLRRYRYLPSPAAETLGLGGGMLPGLRQRKLDAFKVPFLLWGQHRALQALHREDPIRLLHSHWLIPQGVVGGRFARSGGIPHVSTAHGSDLLGLRLPGVDAALRYAVRRSDRVTVNSRAMARALRIRTGASRAVQIAIGASVPDAEAIRGNLELRRDFHPGARVLGFVGRLVQKKGILEFLRAVAAVRRRDPNIVGLVVGGGGAETEARALAEELGLGSRVRFVGPVSPDRVAAPMSVMDVLVVPSHYEAQGLVAIEAMLLGLPVVAFETGGLREVVVDDETGLTVEEGDVPGLARAVERLLSDAGLRRRLAARARARAVERFTLSAAADRFDELYGSMLEA